MTTGAGEPVEVDGDDAATSDDEHLIRAMRQRDETAFAALVDRYHGQLVRLAMA